MVDEAISVTLETAKNLGIKGINEFIDLNANDLSFSTGNVQDSKLKKYDILAISQEILDKILAGKIRRYEQLTKEIDLQAQSDRDKWV